MKQTNKEFHPARRLIQLQFTFSQFYKKTNCKSLRILVRAKPNQTKMKPAHDLMSVQGGLKMNTHKRIL